ncbi:MAG: hypothetical protein JSV00_07855 [bacterium]|nr:MAG: hypothetical protein JSV00_07855 [bacterium]
MKKAVLVQKNRWVRFMLPAVFAPAVIFVLGCGTGSSVTATGGTQADEAAVLTALESEEFFTDSVTDTSIDEEAAAAAGAQVSSSQLSLLSLPADGGTAQLPLFWWRGQMERLGREIDIHIQDGSAFVTVVCDVAGTFFIADEVGGTMVLWGKPFEDLVTRHASFEKTSSGWVLSAVSPVEFALADADLQTVFIRGLRAYVGEELVWETVDPAALFSVPEGIPTFSRGDQVRVEASIANASDPGWEPPQFVFLHHPGHRTDGRRSRDLMFDDGTNGDVLAGDGVYTRVYTIGPCGGRHFAAVDVIDSTTFMVADAPYNSTAWGMPYIVR